MILIDKEEFDVNFNNAYGFIYMIINKINNKIYFGQTMDDFNIRYHNNFEKNTKNKHLKRSIEKYGIENFYIDEVFDVAYTKEEIDLLEDMYIKLYDTTNPIHGYNKRFGGSSGRHTEDAKRKNRESHLGKESPRKGVKASEESKRKMSESKKGMYIGEDNPNWGKKHSDKSRLAMSIGHKGIFDGEKNPMYGKHHSEKTIEKIRRAHFKKIICVTTLEIFDAIIDGSKKYNVNSSHIVKCCKYKQRYAGKHPETGEPLIWMYYEDWINKGGV